MKNRFRAVKGLVFGLTVVIAGTGLTGCGMLRNAVDSLSSSIQSGRYGTYVDSGSFEYALRERDNSGYISKYYWDGSDENRYIIMPDELDGVTINCIGGIYGNGNPNPFGVDMSEGLKSKNVREVAQTYNLVIDVTEYYDFYLIADTERIAKDSIHEMCFYEEDAKTLYVSRVTVIDTSLIFTDTDDGRSLLPGLTDIEKITYRAESLGESNDRVPGPTDYRYYGVAYISEEEAVRISSEYELEDSEAEIDAAIGYMCSDLEGREWKTSKKLSRDLIKPGYGGDVYVSDNVIYFVIFTS